MNGLKRAYIDTETSGLDPKLNAVIEIGCIIEIDRWCTSSPATRI